MDVNLLPPRRGPSRLRRTLVIALEYVLLMASLAGVTYLGQRAVSEDLTRPPAPTVAPAPGEVTTR